MTRKQLALMLLGLAAIGLVAPLPAAQADPVLELLECEPYGRTPRYTDTRLNVIGNGYASGTNCGQVLDYLEVCLDYNGVTLTNTCRTYQTAAGGDSGKTKCMPGVWDTIVIAHYVDKGVEVAHSGDGQGLPLVVTTECRLQ